MTDTHQAVATAPPDPPAPEPITKRSIAPLLALLGVLAVLTGIGGWPLLLVIFALVASVTLHELGHYLTAKSAGMKVTEFFLGAGPRIWSFRRGETEYGIKAVPVLAYVRVIGMNNLDDVEPADEPRAYRSAPFWRRLTMAGGGPFMNFAIAAGCIWAVLVFAGAPSTGLFRPAPEPTNWHIEVVSPGSAAAAAGIQPGDKVVSVDGQAVVHFSDLHDIVVGRKGQTVPIVVERGGSPLTVSATIGERDGVGFLGVQSSSLEPTLHKDNAVTAVPRSIAEVAVGSWETIKVIGQKFSPAGLGDLASQVADAGHTRDQGPVVSDGNSSSSSSSTSSTSTTSTSSNDDRLMSVIGAVGIGTDLAKAGWVDFVYFLAVINLFLGLINLVPLLPFDGGHIAIAVYEKIRSMAQGGRAYHADVAKLMPITYGVVMVLAFIGLSTMYLDIVAPVHLQ